MSGRERILELLKSKVGEEVSRPEIMEAARISEWARRVRELTQAGWDIETTQNGYRLRSLKQQTTVQRANVSQRQRYRILHRDNSQCQKCGATVEDGVKLVVDHKIPVDWGGPTADNNLWTLCNECNAGKKAWESDADAEAMKRILCVSGALNRLREYFKFKHGEVCTREELQLVSGIAQYARRIRELRDEGMNIQPANTKGDYVFKTENCN